MTKSLHELLAPQSLDEFVREYWDRRGLYRAGDGQAPSWLFSEARFLAAVGRCDPRSRPWDASYVTARRDGESLGRVEPDDVPALVADGAHICAHAIDCGDPALADFARSAKHALGYAGNVGVSAYRSPPGGGLAPHFDAQSIITIQIRGRKRWRFGTEAVISNPPSNYVTANREGEGGRWVGDASNLPKVEAPDPSSFTEATLAPGDLLYLPAGAWHTTEALDESLSIALYFAPVTMATMVENLTWATMSDAAPWRAGPPPCPEGSRGGLAPSVRGYLRERFAELIEQLDAWRDDPELAALTWMRMVIGPPVARSAPLPKLTQDTPLRRLSPALYLQGVDADEDPVLRVACASGNLELAPAVAPMLDRLADRRDFRAGEALSWLGMEPRDWPVLRELLEVLYEHGLLGLQTTSDPVEAGEP